MFAVLRRSMSSSASLSRNFTSLTPTELANLLKEKQPVVVIDLRQADEKVTLCALHTHNRDSLSRPSLSSSPRDAFFVAFVQIGVAPIPGAVSFPVRKIIQDQVSQFCSREPIAPVLCDDFVSSLFLD
jgi:hypothetical protein